MAGVASKSWAKRLQVKQRAGEEDLNRDNVPLPPSRRTWGYWSYVGFWVTTGVNVSGWSGGAALLGLGLTVGQAMAVTVAAQAIIVSVWILTGWVGAYWHVSFPMWSRSVWGIKAAYFPLINRIILSFTWTATQGWFGGQCLKVFLGSMFPSIYRMKNTLPESAFMTNADFMCFALFTVLTMPLLLIPPEHIRRPMVFVCFTSTVTAFTLFIWSLARGHGGGPLMKPEGLALLGVEPARGSQLGWAVVYGISTSLGSICAGILNQSDYTRFAIRPSAPFLTLALCQPVVGTLTNLIGIVCTSVAAQHYPDEGLLWTPYELLRVVQKHGGPGARAAVFFACGAFVLSQWGINVPGNLLAGGIDLTSLWPRYLNIRRGAYITLAISVAMCPWALLSGSNTFLSVMGGYAVFLAPITGTLVFDFFFVHQRKLKLTALYECNSSSIYYYWKGVNWRAVIAWACGVGPLFPGFLNNVAGTRVPEGIKKLYFLCWPLGFTVSGVVLVVLSKVFPVAGVGEVDELDVFGTKGEPETTRGTAKDEFVVNELQS
ncbi:hypothetical protein CcaverHIS641_0311740 [Cutaneotrichosporon cavernicola]|nr:hypothetical protein CcaverHIS641_0311740 [Cutaneotrichosporon cavernicola]